MPFEPITSTVKTGGFEPITPTDEWEPVRSYLKGFSPEQIKQVHGTSDVEAIIEKGKKELASSQRITKSFIKGATGANVISSEQQNIPATIAGGVAPYLIPFGKGIATAAKFAVIPAAQEIVRQTTTPEKLSTFQKVSKVGTAAAGGFVTGHFFDKAGVLKSVLPRVLTRGATMGGVGAVEQLGQQSISGEPLDVAGAATSGLINLGIGTILGAAVEIPALRSSVWNEAVRINKAGKVAPPKNYAEAKEVVKSIMQDPEGLSPIFRDAVYRQKYSQALKEIKAKYQPGIGELLPLRKATKALLTDKGIQQRYNTLDSVAGKYAQRMRQSAELISKQTGRPVEQVFAEITKGSLYEVIGRDPIYRDLIAKGADPVDIYMAVTEAEKIKTPPPITEAIPTKQGKQPLTEYFRPARKLETLPAIKEQAGISKGVVHVSEGTGVRTIEIPGYSGWVKEESTKVLSDTAKVMNLKNDKGEQMAFNQLPAVMQAEANAELQKAIMSEEINTDEQKQTLAKEIIQDKLQGHNIYFVGSERPISGDTPVFSSYLNRAVPIKELVDKLKHGVEYVINGMTVRESIRPDQWAIHVGQLEFQKPGLADKLRNMITQMYQDSTIPEARPQTPTPPPEARPSPQEVPPAIPPQGMNMVVVRDTADGDIENTFPDVKTAQDFIAKEGDRYVIDTNISTVSPASIPQDPVFAPPEAPTAPVEEKTPIELSQEEDFMQSELKDLTSGVRDGIVSVDVVKPAFFTGDMQETSRDVDILTQYYDLTQEWKDAIEASNVTRDYDAKIKALQARLNARRKVEDKITGKVTYARKYSHEKIFQRIAQLEADKQKVLAGMRLTKEDIDRVNAIYNEEANALLEQMSPILREKVQKSSVDKTKDLLTKLQTNLWVTKTAKDKIVAEDEANPEYQEDVNTIVPEIDSNNLADVGAEDTVTDIPLEEGEDLVTEYNETFNETTVSMIEVDGQNVENVSGVPVLLKGEFAFAVDPDKKGQVKLVNKEQSVWITKENLRELLCNSNFVKMVQKKLTNRRGSIINPAKIAQEMARAFYNMFKPLKDKPYALSNDFKQTYPLKRILESLQFIDDLDKFFEHMAAQFPELKTLLKGPQYPKETITNVLTDKRFDILAEYIAKTTLKDPVDFIYEQALKDVQERNPEIKPGAAEKAAREKVKFITWLMFRAGEEIRVPFNKNLKFPGLLFFERSELGIRHPYKVSANPLTPDGEMQAVVRDLHRAYKYMNIPYTSADVQKWTKERPSLAFFRLLAHSALTNDDTYQRIVVWAKSEADNPLLMDQIAAGMFTHSDIFNMWLRGYQRRPWTKADIEKTGGDPTRISVGTADVQAQKYRTNSEFAWQSKRQGLQPVDDWITSERLYIRDSLKLLAQVRLLNRFKMLRNPNPIKMPGFEDNAEVNKYVQLVKVVDYEVSPVIKKISELTRLTPNDIFKRLGYVNAHNLPGFALYLKGTGDRFQPPHVIRELYDTFAHTYAPKSGPLSTFFTIANAVSFFPRMVLTVAPFDSPSRYLTPVFITNPISIATTAADMFSKGLIGGPLIGYKILKGEYDPLDYYNTEKYEDLPKYIANGFPRHMIDVMKSQYDIEKMQDIIPELNDTWENIKEWALSMGGFNAAIFDRIILPKLYDVVHARHMHLLSKGYDDETAARLATLSTTNQSYLLDSNIWGAEGAAWATILFSKGLTPGFVRLLMAAMYPIITAKPWRTPGKRVARFMYGYKGKPPLSWFNAFFLGDVGEKDLDEFGKSALKTVFMVIFLWNLFGNMAQWMMSWADPRSEEDKDPRSLWRFMFANDWRHKFLVKLPYKDINSRDVYLDQQYLVEAAQIGDLMLNAAGKILQRDERWGKEPMDIMRNKLSMGVNLMISLMTNRDPRTGKNIVTPGASKDIRRKQFSNWMTQTIRPFQVRREAPLTEKDYNDFFKTSEWFGFARKPGEISEQGYSDEQIEHARQSIANYEALRTFERDELESMTEDELLNSMSDFISPETIQEEWVQKNFPVSKMMQDNQKAMMIMDLLKSGKKKDNFEPIK